MQRTSTSAERLRSTLQLAILDALMSARRWAPYDIAFQGGTSLRLIHGSPRFSEDLDFLVRDGLKLDRIEAAIAERLGQPQWLPAGQRLAVTQAKAANNPQAFDVQIRGAAQRDPILAHVKVELYRAPADTLEKLCLNVRPVSATTGALAGAAVNVPALTAQEIYADKVFALAARPYLKPRDLFDLDWLPRHATVTPPSLEDLQRRFAMYPRITPRDWLDASTRRRAVIGRNETAAVVEKDLRRWLPSSWPLTQDGVATMLQRATGALHAAEVVIAPMASTVEPPIAPSEPRCG